MDLFTGKKIAELRRFRSLSQEALAEKIGVSRQAVSKWERGEASPDMDNVIALADVFGITVDDLLGDKKAVDLIAAAAAPSAQPPVDKTPENPAAATDAPDPQPTAQPESVPSEEAPTDRKSALAARMREKLREAKNAKKDLPRYRPELADKLKKIPVFILIPLLYVVCGILFHTWHPGWLSILLIPVYYMFLWACCGRNRKSFLLRLPIPFLAIILYIFTGLLFNTWHPGWIVFLCIPAYYAAVLFGIPKE